jgi:hypothetical protein
VDTKIQEYLARAEAARREAERAKLDDFRESFRRVAKEWERMAEELRAGPNASEEDHTL